MVQPLAQAIQTLSQRLGEVTQALLQQQQQAAGGSGVRGKGRSSAAASSGRLDLGDSQLFAYRGVILEEFATSRQHGVEVMVSGMYRCHLDLILDVLPHDPASVNWSPPVIGIL